MLTLAAHWGSKRRPPSGEIPGSMEGLSVGTFGVVPGSALKLRSTTAWFCRVEVPVGPYGFGCGTSDPAYLPRMYREPQEQARAPMPVALPLGPAVRAS